MQEPFRNISIVHYERTNTVGVAIFDSMSTYREFAIQYAPNPQHAVPVIIVGGPSNPDSTYSLATNDAATRRALLDILIRYGRGQRDVDAVIASVTGAPTDRSRHSYDATRDKIRDLISLLFNGDHGS